MTVVYSKRFCPFSLEGDRGKTRRKWTESKEWREGKGGMKRGRKCYSVHVHVYCKIVPDTCTCMHASRGDKEAVGSFIWHSQLKEEDVVLVCLVCCSDGDNVGVGEPAQHLQLPVGMVS